MTQSERKKAVSRVVIFAGKAAPGYFMAKLIITLINSVALVINSDSEIDEKLKVVFIPDYNVSLAEIIIPAADVSQHISTAGTEASGTSNMKFTMNGGVIVGTLDGATIEIREQVGEKNMFIFGAKSNEVPALRIRNKDGNRDMDPRMAKVIESVEKGQFGSPDIFIPLLNTIKGDDFYLLRYDFAGYIEAQEKVDEFYLKPDEWVRMSVLNTAGSGLFSSDRSIKQYASEIWKVEPCPIPNQPERPVIANNSN